MMITTGELFQHTKYGPVKYLSNDSEVSRNLGNASALLRAAKRSGENFKFLGRICERGYRKLGGSTKLNTIAQSRAISNLPLYASCESTFAFVNYLGTIGEIGSIREFLASF